MSGNISENLDIITIDKVANTIFTSCDVEAEDTISVPRLLDYLKPFMQMDHLNTLRLELDPEDNGQSVTKAHFTEALTKWSLNFKESNFAEINAIRMGSQSTPRPSLDFNPNQQFPQFNISNIITFDSNQNDDHLNGSLMEEKVKEFQYQLSKTTIDLEIVKEQLGTAEIQNESLLVELNDLKKNLHDEQQLNKQLLTYKSDCEDFKLEVNVLKSQNDQLKASLSVVDKEKLKFMGKITDLEEKVYASQVTNSGLLKREQDLKKRIVEVRNEIDLKNAEITALEKITAQMKRELQEQGELIVFYKNENELMKHKSQSMEQLCQQTVDESLQFKLEVFSQNGCECSKSMTQLDIDNSSLQRIITPTTNLKKMVMERNAMLTSTPLEQSEQLQIRSCPSLVSPIATTHDLKSSKSLSDFNGIYQSEDDVPQLSNNRTNGQQTPKTLHQELLEGLKTNLFTTCNSCGDDGSQLKCSRFLNPHPNINEMHLELREQEDIKNSLWGSVQEMQKTLSEKDTVIEQLRKELAEEQRAVRQLRGNSRQREMVVKAERKLAEMSRKLDETKAHSQFLDKSRQSLEHLWNENQILLTKSDNHLIAIHGKLGEMLNAITISYAHDPQVYRKLEMGAKIESLGSMIDLLMEHVNNLSGNSNRTQSFERQEVRIAKLEKYVEYYQDLWAAEKRQTGLLTKERDSLVEEKGRLEERLTILSEDLSKCEMNIRQKFDEDFTFLRNESRGLMKEIETLKQEKAELEACNKTLIDVQREMCQFLEGCNSNMQSVIYNVVSRVRSLFGDDSVQDINDYMAQSSVEIDNKAKYWLLKNIELVSLILDVLLEKSSEILSDSTVDKSTTKNESGCEDYNSSSFLDLGEEIPCFPTLSDDFLENLGLGDTVDLRSLTLQELEEKFATLALTWAIDFKTCDGRIDRQKLHHRTCLSKYCKSLATSLKSSESLIVLQREVEEALGSAEQLGRLSCEKRTMGCWKLVASYVAALRHSTQQLELKAQGRLNPVLTTTVQSQSYDGDLSSISSRWSGWVLLLLASFVILAMLGIFIHCQCRKLGEFYVSPLDYLFALLFKKVKSPFVLY